jgi:hypothetical protein
MIIIADVLRILPESGEAPGSTVFWRRPLGGLLNSPAAVSDDVMLGSRMSRCEPLPVTICGIKSYSVMALYIQNWSAMFRAITMIRATF